jgi:hypothetical protein
MSETKFEELEGMTVTEMTEAGLYVIAEVIDGIEQMVDCFFFADQAKEAFNTFKKFNTAGRKSVLRRPDHKQAFAKLISSGKMF